MAEDASPETTPSGSSASGGTSPSSSGPPPGGESPLEDLESAVSGDDPFGGENPFGEGAFSDEPAALMVTKFWIRQNALLSVGLAFAAGTLIGALKQ
ncbi:MAG: hypothetical protein BRD37_05120 [Bacteroidetes bacterium QH_8_67_23]|jgi:hypothetical protein|nr:MAG: hypothetical protein BRD37_05120 [Bacteroidetes bacterium QH_8_67_23]